MAKKPESHAVPEWFSPKRYAWVEDETLSSQYSIWSEFKIRAAAYTHPELLGHVIEAISKGDGRYYSQPLIESPADSGNGPPRLSGTSSELVKGNPHPFLKGLFAISPLTVFDATMLSEDIDPDVKSGSFISDPVVIVEDPEISGSFREFIYENVQERLSIDTYRISRNEGSPISHKQLHCKIDLDYSDDAIIASLKSFLPVWRKCLNEVSGVESSSPKSAVAELAKIKSYRLIQFLDLKLWKIHTGSKITINEMISNVFSDGDEGEKDYWKTIHPMLEKLLEVEWQFNLRSALIKSSVASKSRNMK